MAKSSSIFALKSKGKIIPTDVLKSILATNASAIGAMVTTDYKEVEFNHFVGKVELDNVEAVQQAFKEHTVLFNFVHSEGPPMESDVQPYPVLWDKDNNVIIGAALFGNFNKNSGDGKHSPEFVTTHEIVTAKLKDIYEIVDGNTKKVLEYLRRENVRKEFIGLGDNDTEILVALLAADGSAATLFLYENTETIRAQHDWGWMAKAKEIVAKAEETKQVEAKTEAVATGGKPKMDFGKKTTATAEPSTTPVTTPSPAPTETPPDAPGEEKIKVGPPPRELSNKDKKKWWNDRLGYHPQDWRHGIVEVSKSAIKDLKLLGIAAAQGHIKTVETKPPAEAIVGVLSADTLAQIGAKFVKAKDVDSLSVDDPLKLQESEKRLLSFTEQTGIDLSVAANWKYETLLRLGKEVGVEALAMLAKDFRNALRAAQTQSGTAAPAATSNVTKPKLDFGKKVA